LVVIKYYNNDDTADCYIPAYLPQFDLDVGVPGKEDSMMKVCLM